MRRDWLRSIRKAKCITQTEISRKLGITQSHYSSIERGERGPSVKIAKGIGNILKVDWRRFYKDV